VSYYILYYLDADLRIIGATSMPFEAPAEAVRHANTELERHSAVEVWAEGVQLCLAQRPSRTRGIAQDAGSAAFC
jgi:hypothetical protein